MRIKINKIIQFCFCVTILTLKRCIMLLAGGLIFLAKHKKNIFDVITAFICLSFLYKQSC